MMLCVNVEWKVPVWACKCSERADARRLLWANQEPLKFKIQQLWANHNILMQIMHLLRAV